MMKKFKTQYIFAVMTVILLFILCGFMANINKNSNSDNPETSTSVSSAENTEEQTTKRPPATFVEETTEEVTSKSWDDYTTKELKKLIDFDAEFPYMIRVNRAQNWAMIYAMDKDGHYSIPYKVFICSTGLNEGDTPLGLFSISDKYDWRLMVDGSYAQYAIRISGPIMLHSVPYYSPNKNDLEVEEYAKLGSPASLGCIRFNVKNVKWIYDNCPAGTRVVVYEDYEEEPLLKLPKKRKAESTGPRAGWDPTDPDENNPWKKK